MKIYLTKITKLIIMLFLGWILPFCTFAQVTATEDFENETSATSFSESGINFTHNFTTLQNLPPFGYAGSAKFLELFSSGANTVSTANLNLNTTTNPAIGFKINSFAAYTAGGNSGSPVLNGIVTISGTPIGGGAMVSASINILSVGAAGPTGVAGQTRDANGIVSGINLAGTALDGLFFTSLSFQIVDTDLANGSIGTRYFEFDHVNFTTSAAVTNQYAISNVSYSEGNSGSATYAYNITRSLSTAAGSVQIQSSNGTATAGSDYVAIPLTTINFPIGSLTQSVNVTINGDVTVEPNETINMTLSNPVGGTLQTAAAVVTILDDDLGVETFEGEVSGATTFSEIGVNFMGTGRFKVVTGTTFGAGGSASYLASPAPFATGNQGSIKVTSVGKSVNAVSVALWSASAAGSTYNVVNCSVTFTGTKADNTGTVTHTAPITPTGVNGHFTVSFAGSPLANVPLSEIAFSVSAAANYLQVDNFTFTVNSFSNTQLSINDVSILEGTAGGNSAAIFTVTRTNNTTAFSVDVASSNVTATASTDYTALPSTTLNFTNGGSLTQTVSVPIIKDAGVEPNETFNMTLTNATNGTLFFKQVGIGTILNDDGNITETYEDEVTNATTFSENGIAFSATSGYKVVGGTGGTTGSGSSALFLSSINNAVGNMGSITLTSPNIAFTLKTLDAWVGTSPSAFSSGPVTFTGTLFGGGTVSTTKTITATSNTGTGWQQNITFTGTPLDNLLLTSLQVITGGALKYCDIDNLNFSISYTSPFIAVTDASNNAIANGGAANTVNNTNFGSTCVTGGSISKTYTIKNTGLGNLTLSGAPLAVVGGTDASQFSVATQPTSPLAAAGSVTFTVVFNPTTAGTKNATITLTNNDASNNPYVINVTGIGNADPTVTLGTVPSICASATSFTIPYTATTNSPVTYSISGAGFTTVTDGTLPATPITVVLTAPVVVGTNPTYNLTVKNANGCFSATASGTITVNASSLPANAQVVTQSVINNSISASGCAILVNVLPNGAAPVTGNVTAKVWVETTQPVQFVNRHYEINPVTSAANATAKITLYFSDAEFNSFNAQTPAPALLLPISTDAPATITARKTNIFIEKRAGTGDANGTLNSYLGAVTTIDPADADIIWNATSSRWEVSFNVVGFSGFWLKTQLGVLPLNLISFTGTKTSNGNLLQWKTASEINTKTFEIERQLSMVGGQWSVVGSLLAVGNGANNYSYTDVDKLNGTVYYRLKMIDNDGRFTYSNIIKLSTLNLKLSTIYPNPITTTATLEIGDRKLLNTQATIIDTNGKNIKTILIQNNFEIIDVNMLGSGVYILKLANGVTLKMIKK